MIGQRIAHYEVTGKIGEGGMGEVYRATDSKLNRDVALKILPDQFSADEQRMGRFQREAQLLASLSHANIGAIYGVEEQDGTHALVLELIEGQGLDELIARGPIPFEQALQIALQIAEALEAAHDKGITHRDLKPANVKITPQGQVKVLDFGLAKAVAVDQEPSSPELTQSPTLTMAATQAGMILGTAAYMSPEQAQGLAVDRRSDIWAWGVVLFEMLTGRSVFEGDNVSLVMAHVLSRDPDWDRLPSDVPTRIRDLLEHCLRKDPKARLQAIGDARIAIEDYLAAPEEEKRPVGGLAPAKASWLPWLTTASLAALVIVLAGLLLSRPDPVRPSFTFSLPPVAGDIAPLHFAVSPDGRWIVRATQQGLWLRRFDEPEGRLLQHLGGFPFWSPDSEWLGFVFDNKLKKARLDGGPAQTLCSLNGNFFGASWGSSGTILFSELFEGEPALFQVPVAGGEPARVEVPTEGYRGKLWPQFLPTGNEFLFLASNFGDPTGGQIGMSSLDDSAAVTMLVASGLRARFHGSGHLLFLREGTLMAQQFDPSDRSLQGEAFPLAEQIMSDGPVRMTAFDTSVDGLLAYRGGQATAFGLKWFDRGGGSRPVGAEERLPENPRPSLGASDRLIALQRGEPPDIWIMDPVRGTVTRATFDSAADTYPVFAPDETRFVFASSRGDDQTDNLYVKSTSGTGEAELLLALEDRLVATDWSRDGRYVLFTRIGEGRSIWAVAVEGNDREPIRIADVPFDMRHGKISPDGQWVTYASTESGPTQVYLVPFPGSGRLGKWQISANGGAQPVWGPDGKEIFFLAPDLDLMVVEMTLADDPVIGAPRILFPVTGLPSATDRFAVSSDGERFLVPTFLGGEGGPAAITIETNWRAGPGRR